MRVISFWRAQEFLFAIFFKLLQNNLVITSYKPILLEQRRKELVGYSDYVIILNDSTRKGTKYILFLFQTQMLKREIFTMIDKLSVQYFFRRKYFSNKSEMHKN